ncbi:MAG: VTT domain-containing protein, partial [Candidatus Bathyarchaeota archaeon]|nr:VTT domain-containing protein [Candidatus Bathyarchaeota archaeon]
GSLLEEAGLVGIFLASMFSHLTVVGRDVFAPAFVSMMKYYSPVLLGFSAGVGGAIGEVTTYYWGLGIKEAVEENEENSTVSKWIEKYGLLAILLVAASPLPDTPVALLAGSARFPFRKFLIVEVIGKSLFYSLGAAAGSVIFESLSGFVSGWVLSILVVVASLTLCVIASWKRSREKVLQLLRRFLR